jgi:predicted NACHT family NTPase
MEKIVLHLGGDVQRFRRLWADAAAPGRDDNDATTARFLEQYLSAVARFHQAIERYAQTEARRIPFDRIYIDQRLRRFHDSSNTSILNASDLLRDARRVVILGDPGSGKSVLCQALVLRAARDRSGRVPFLIRIRDFAPGTSPARSVADYLDDQCRIRYQLAPPSGALVRLLSTGKAIVIFDGLDELMSTTKMFDVLAIIELFASEYPQASLIVTSRLVGYDRAPLDRQLFADYRLENFDESDILRYATNWFSMDQKISKDETNRLATDFLVQSSFATDLRQNALMLSLMCSIFSLTGDLPSNQPDLYRLSTELLFNRWDRRRGIKGDDRIARVSALFRLALASIAFQMLDRRLYEISGREVVRLIGQYFDDLRSIGPGESEQMAQDFLDFCRGRAWVLSEVGTSGVDSLYTFTHRTFFEYFAAVHLAHSFDTSARLAEVLLTHIVNGDWLIQARLAVQMIDEARSGGAEQLLRTMLDATPELDSDKRALVLDFIKSCLHLIHISPELTRAVNGSEY